MKALSIRQPWARLIINGYKDIENRTWKTKFRGKVLIHASQKIDNFLYVSSDSRFKNILLPAPKELETGGIIGEIDIIDCVDSCSSIWFEGPYGFVLRNPRRLPFKPCKGKLGFFEI